MNQPVKTLICLLLFTVLVVAESTSAHDHVAQFISDQTKEFSHQINIFNRDDLIHSTASSQSSINRSIKQESCVPLTIQIDYCYGFIPNNVSYIVTKSLSTLKSKLENQIDNFIAKMELNYGPISSSCKNSAINLYCSMSFRRCVHDRSQGIVELYKPCQYLCTELYMNCIPDRAVAIASAKNDCGDDTYPKAAYSKIPQCTDIYFDRELTSYYIMSFTLLGLGLVSSLFCGGSFLICICCAKSIKPISSSTGDAYNPQQSETSSVNYNRQSINSGFRFSVDETKPITGTNSNSSSAFTLNSNNNTINTVITNNGGSGTVGGAEDNQGMTNISIN